MDKRRQVRAFRQGRSRTYRPWERKEHTAVEAGKEPEFRVCADRSNTAETHERPWMPHDCRRGKAQDTNRGGLTVLFH